jgi:hypothetical protein
LKGAFWVVAIYVSVTIHVVCERVMATLQIDISPLYDVIKRPEAPWPEDIGMLSESADTKINVSGKINVHT